MPPFKSHAVGIERVALYYVLKILETEEVGYPPELKGIENPSIEEARVTLVFELALMTTQCIAAASSGFKDMTVWMKCENSKFNSEGAIAFKSADSIIKDSIKIKSKYYNILKLLLMGDIANPNQTNKHPIIFDYTPISKLWIKNSSALQNLHPFLEKTKHEFTSIHTSLAKFTQEMREYADKTPEPPTEEKIKYFLQKYSHADSTTNSRKSFLSSSQQWWLNFTNKLSTEINRICTNNCEEIIIRMIDKEKLNSSMKNQRQNALSLNHEIEKRCKLAYIAIEHFGALGQENPKIKSINREWRIHKITEDARIQDDYIENLTNKPAFHQHPDYKNLFSSTPFLELRHIQTAALWWIFAKTEKTELNFINPLSFIKNDLVLEKIIAIESSDAQENPQSNKSYINTITLAFNKNNPKWPSIVEDLYELLCTYYKLSRERKTELYSKIMDHFLKDPENLEDWLHLPLSRQDPIEFISTRPSEDVARDLFNEQKDGDFTGAFIGNSEFSKRYFELLTKKPNSVF